MEFDDRKGTSVEATDQPQVVVSTQDAYLEQIKQIGALHDGDDSSYLAEDRFYQKVGPGRYFNPRNN